MEQIQYLKRRNLNIPKWKKENNNQIIDKLGNFFTLNKIKIMKTVEVT